MGTPIAVLEKGFGDTRNPWQRPGSRVAQAGVVQAPVDDSGDVAGGVDLA